ncbi:MAG: hypothetical protein M0R03_02125 [Novosphingobium sp.]|nr:hypothetical protein [Novosphingobium sp.]
MADADGLLLVMQTPKAGREQDHLDWYVSTHLPDVCSVPGAIRGEFTAVAPGTENPRWTNAAAYWLQGNPAEFLNEVFNRVQAGQWQLSDTLDSEQTAMMIAEAITPRMRSEVTADVDPAERLLYIVLTNPTEGDDDTFNEWYSGTHIPDVIAVPGFVAAQRFRFVDHPALKPYPFRYAALYEVKASEAQSAFAELSARAGTDRMVLSPTLSKDPLHAAPFAPVGIQAGVAA